VLERDCHADRLDLESSTLRCILRHIRGAATMQGKTVSLPWRRYLRISVRGLIVLVLLAGFGLGWLVRSANIQRTAAAAIKNARGTVLYDWEFRNGTHILAGKPWAPDWLVRLVGVDYFGHVTSAHIWASSPQASAALAKVEHLTRLERLGLTSDLVDDDALIHLKGLTKLEYLDLSSTHVTGAGLVHLKELTKLSYLSLADTQVSDAGLVHLRALAKLSYVGLARTLVSDGGVEQLQRALPGLHTYHGP
jgi:hypothetical protein